MVPGVATAKNAEPCYCQAILMLCSAGILDKPSLLLLMVMLSLLFFFSCRWEMRDCVIVNPGAVCVMVRLLPKLYKEGHSQVSMSHIGYLLLFPSFIFEI